MSGPSFDELVGAEATGAERERLRRVHELLVEAGPPPELTPRLEAGPALSEMHVLRRRRVKRRGVLLLAAAVAAGAVFAAGYGVGSSGNGGPPVAATLALKGTSRAPNAVATLQIEGESSGNWPMTLTVRGLPPLPGHALYEVYLVRGGKPWAPCGTFVVAGRSTVTVPLNAPYAFHSGDSWVVTRQSPGDRSVGPVVLRPVNA